MAQRIDKETENNWRDIAGLIKKAHAALENARRILLLDMGETGRPLDRINNAIESVQGEAYMFTPQTEWLGGDSLDDSNHVATLPYIAR